MSDSDASSNVEVKAEPNSRVRQQEAKGKRVSRPPNGRRMHRGGGDQEEKENRAENEEGSDEDGEQDEQEDDEAAQQQGRKRLKTLNGRPRPSEAMDVEDGADNDAFIATKIFERDAKDGYLPGSIVRICCENFLTYDFVQFSPGARMNMILGPNGTGKSTIACAICIGLGFPTSVLGRADNLQAFVKHGYEQGYVEIELKGPIGKKNVSIRRNITTKSGASTWAINDKTAPKNKVDAVVAALGVQVGNLCSFLPQDRVNEFAKLKPDELLVETQKVAGHAKLKDWHDQLIEMGKDLKEIKEAIETEAQDCSAEEGKNSIIERQVKAFERRKQFEDNLSLYNILIPYYTLKRDKVDYNTLKVRAREAGVKYHDAVAEHKPIIKLKDKFEEEVKDATKRAKDAQSAVNRAQKDVENLKDRDKQHAATCQSIQEEISALHRSEEDAKKNIRTLKERIRQNKAQLEELQGEDQEDSQPWMAKKEDINRRKKRVQSEQQEKEDAIRELERDIQIANTDGRRASDDLKRLKDATQQRYQNMTHYGDNRFRGIPEEGFMRTFTWLMENKGRFQNVIEPACFSVQVTDPRYSHAVETCIPVSAMKTFIFDNRPDYDTFNEAMDRKTFGDYRPTSWYRPKGEVEPPERSLEELRRAGFDGYAIDFVEAPEFMKWYLKRQHDMHRVAVATNPNAVDQEAATRMFSPANPGATNRYIIGLQLFTLSRSFYGRRLVQNSNINMNKAVWFTEQPIDRDRQKRYEDMIALATDTINEKNVLKGELEAQEEVCRNQIRDIKKEVEGIDHKLSMIKTKLAKIERTTRTLDADEQTLIAEENRPSLEQRAAKLKANLVQKVKIRLEAVPRLKAAIAAANGHIETFTLATYQIIQATSDVENVTKIMEKYTARHEALKKEKDELSQLVGTMKGDMAEKQQALVTMINQSPDEIQERARTYQAERGAEMSQPVITALIDELETEKADVQRNLDSTTRVNQSVITAYQEREAKIQRLKESIRRQEKAKLDSEAKIKKVKDQWLPQLNALIARVNERFSAAFDRIGCAGEVRLAEHEEFDKWSIEILVKFRDTESLQLLTGQRQSGGERSLTTILYLMSLTGLAKTPFALVDEINQGMDFKYERHVHNELIQVTCAEDSGQYFLITPKLLPNLTYHENVTALVINNGDYIPETRDENGKATNYGDLGANLAAYRQAMRKA